MSFRQVCGGYRQHFVSCFLVKNTNIRHCNNKYTQKLRVIPLQGVEVHMNTCAIILFYFASCRLNFYHSMPKYMPIFLLNPLT